VLAVMIVRVDSGGAFLYRGGFLLAAVAAMLFVGAASVDGPVAVGCSGSRRWLRSA